MKLKLKNITTLPEMQARVRMDEDLIQTLESVYREKQTLYGDPILVWKQEDGRWLVIDGHHRLEAAKRAGLEEINAKEPFLPHMKDGYGWLDAQKDSIMTNARHGARLTRADVTRAVGLLLARDPAMGPEEIARVVNRSKSVVYECMRELSGSGKLTLPETRTGKDGKIRPTTYAKREVCRKPEPEDMTEAPARLEAEEGGTDAPKPGAETVYCAGGCGKFVSRVYLEELELEDDAERTSADWLKVRGDWYCPECSEEKSKTNWSREELRQELLELAILFPCMECGGTPSVLVDDHGKACVKCTECGKTDGFFVDPYDAVESWRANWESRLKYEDAENAGLCEPMKKGVPCPVCGRTPEMVQMEEDKGGGWKVECASWTGEARIRHFFIVHGETQEKALDMWDKIFAFAEVVK